MVATSEFAVSTIQPLSNLCTSQSLKSSKPIRVSVETITAVDAQTELATTCYHLLPWYVVRAAPQDDGFLSPYADSRRHTTEQFVQLTQTVLTGG